MKQTSFVTTSWSKMRFHSLGPQRSWAAIVRHNGLRYTEGHLQALIHISCGLFVVNISDGYNSWAPKHFNKLKEAMEYADTKLAA